MTTATDHHQVPIAEIGAGTILLPDDGFTCIPGGAPRIVKQDDHGLFVDCCNGQHYLDGQEDDTGTHYVGFRSAPPAPSLIRALRLARDYVAEAADFADTSDDGAGEGRAARVLKEIDAALAAYDTRETSS